MKKILFLLIGAVTSFLQTASAQPLYSWENTNDGWQINRLIPLISPFSYSTNYGVTDGKYSLAVTGTENPDCGVLMNCAATTNITMGLANSTSVCFSVYAPAGSFGGYLQFSLEVYNGDIGYQSLDGHI